MKKNKFKLNDSIKNEAAIVVNDIKNSKSRIRAYAAIAGINILEQYLGNNGLIVDKSNCCSNNPLIIGDFDVADIKAKGIKLDIRVALGDDSHQMMIPRNHLIYGLTPAIYVAVKIDNGMKNAEITGFIEAELIDSSIGNKNFVIVDNSALKPISELIDAINASNIKQKSFLAKDHDKAKEIFVSYMDNEISNADKEYLIRHLANCDECRKDFNTLYKLNKLFVQTSNCKEIAEMFSETIIKQEVANDASTNSFSANDIIAAGAAVVTTAAAGAVITASGAVMANTIAGTAGEAIMETAIKTVSPKKGLFSKIKGVFSKKNTISENIPDVLTESLIEINEINEINELKQNEIISNIQDVLEYSNLNESEIPEIQEENEDSKNITIQDDIQNFVKEISDNVIANFDEEVIQQTLEQENITNEFVKEEFQGFEVIEDEDLENFVEEISPESELSNKFDNTDLSFEVIEEPLLNEDIDMNISTEDILSDELEGDIEDINEVQEDNITPETSYMSNFIKPETIEIKYNSPEQQNIDSCSPENEIVDNDIKEQAEEAAYEENVSEQKETENIDDLLKDIDQVEIVGSLETIDVGTEQIDGSIDLKTNTVVKLNITKREINPIKIAAAVLLATSVSLAGYAYWKYTFLLTDVNPDKNMFKTQNSNIVAELPPSQEQSSEPIKPADPLKTAETKQPVQPKPYVKKAEELGQNNSNDDIAKALVSQSGPVKITNISWEVGASMVSNSVFKNYLMVTGQALKTALATDLTLASERAINDQIKILIILDLQGNIIDTKIKMGSGSNQVDKIVLQTLKNTLSYTKLPSIQTNKKQIKVGLIVNL